jgi:hypothetical protein
MGHGVASATRKDCLMHTAAQQALAISI